MKNYELDVDYSTSIRVELPNGVDLESIYKEVRRLDEFFQDENSEFEQIIKKYGGEVVSTNWGWRTKPYPFEELSERESRGSYKGEFY